MEFVGFTLRNNLFVAPMAGVTDRPFRQLCKRLGAGYAVSEMVTSRRDLWEEKFSFGRSFQAAFFSSGDGDQFDGCVRNGCAFRIQRRAAE